MFDSPKPPLMNKCWWVKKSKPRSQQSFLFFSQSRCSVDTHSSASILSWFSSEFSFPFDLDSASHFCFLTHALVVIPFLFRLISGFLLVCRLLMFSDESHWHVTSKRHCDMSMTVTLWTATIHLFFQCNIQFVQGHHHKLFFRHISAQIWTQHDEPRGHSKKCSGDAQVTKVTCWPHKQSIWETALPPQSQARTLKQTMACLKTIALTKCIARKAG